MSAKYLCYHGCGQPALFETKSGKHQCRAHHRSCPAVLEKGYSTNQKKYGGKQPAASSEVRGRMQETSKERYGVANVSSSPSIKEKRKKVMMDRYGVANAAHIPEARSKISSQKKEYWNRYHNHKDFSVEGLTLKQYIDRCHQYADTMYKRHKDKLDPYGLRGKEWHIDHVYSVADGFRHSVPANIVSDISNLRLVHCSENYAKGGTSHKTLEQLYEDYHAVSVNAS